MVPGNTGGGVVVVVVVVVPGTNGCRSVDVSGEFASDSIPGISNGGGRSGSNSPGLSYEYGAAGGMHGVQLVVDDGVVDVVGASVVVEVVVVDVGGQHFGFNARVIFVYFNLSVNAVAPNLIVCPTSGFDDVG